MLVLKANDLSDSQDPHVGVENHLLQLSSDLHVLKLKKRNLAQCVNSDKMWQDNFNHIKHLLYSGNIDIASNKIDVIPNFLVGNKHCGLLTSRCNGQGKQKFGLSKYLESKFVVTNLLLCRWYFSHFISFNVFEQVTERPDYKAKEN